MIGNVTGTTWRTIAADVDDVPQPDQVNQRHHQLQAYFAYRSEADLWLLARQAEGYEGTIAMAAVSYYGPTDSPSNCWSVTVEKLI